MLKKYFKYSNQAQCRKYFYVTVFLIHNNDHFFQKPNPMKIAAAIAMSARSNW